MSNEHKDWERENRQEAQRKYICLKDKWGSNELDACEYDGVVCIAIFEFECELSKDDTVRLRDFLDSIVKSNAGGE